MFLFDRILTAPNTPQIQLPIGGTSKRKPRIGLRKSTRKSIISRAATDNHGDDDDDDDGVGVGGVVGVIMFSRFRSFHCVRVHRACQ